MSSAEFHYPQEAIEIETYVDNVKGQWEVSLVVVFPDEVVRKTISTYHTQRMAELAASWIKRAARRDAPIAHPANTEQTSTEQRGFPE